MSQILNKYKSKASALWLIDLFQICMKYNHSSIIKEKYPAGKHWQLERHVIVRACGSLPAGDVPAEKSCSPWNGGNRLGNISVTWTGCWGGRSLAVEMKCSSTCCQKWQQRRSERESRQGGTGVELQDVFKTYTPSSAGIWLILSTETGVVQFPPLTQQHSSSNRGQTSGLGLPERW